MVKVARRRILQLAALTALLPSRLTRAAWGRPRHGAMHRALVGLLDRTESARIVGWAYLEARPAERDVDLLTQKIHRALDHQPVARSPAADPERLVEALQAAIQEDFEARRWVSAGGWLISETEGRLCALRCLM